jgi:hypothetical protein
VKSLKDIDPVAVLQTEIHNHPMSNEIAYDTFTIQNDLCKRDMSQIGHQRIFLSWKRLDIFICTKTMY